MRSPREELERIASDLQRVVERLEAADDGEAVFTKTDVDRLISARLAREHKKARRLQERIDELEEEVEELRRELHTGGTSL